MHILKWPGVYHTKQRFVVVACQGKLELICKICRYHCILWSTWGGASCFHHSRVQSRTASVEKSGEISNNNYAGCSWRLRNFAYITLSKCYSLKVLSCFGSHLSATVVLTTAQINQTCTKFVQVWPT